MNRKTFVWVFNYMSVWEKVYLKLNFNSWFFFTVISYAFLNRGRHLYECLITCLRKSISALKWLVLFTFINFFLKTFFQTSILYCKNVHALRSFTYVFCEKCMLGFSAFFACVSLAIFCLDQCQIGIACLAQHLTKSHGSYF